MLRKGARIAVLLLLSVATPACGGDDDTSGRGTPAPQPVAFTRARRAVVLDDADVDVIEASVAVDFSDVSDNFGRAVLVRQLHDQLPFDAVTPTEADRAFSSRIPALWSTIVDEYGAFEHVVVVMDLLDVSGDALNAPPRIREQYRTFTLGASERYPLLVLDEAKAVMEFLVGALAEGQDLTFVAGVGLNGLPTEEFQAFKEFYAGHLYPELRAIADRSTHEVRITTGFDWEAYLASTTTPEAEGAEPGTWEDLEDGLDGALDLLVIATTPTRFERPDDLPDDYYGDLVAASGDRPVAFLPLYWPTRGEDDTYQARIFLERFRFLAAGLNVDFLAWPRLVDLDSHSCSRYAQSLGGDASYCYSGLIKSVGMLKPLWDEILDESVPEEDPAKS